MEHCINSIYLENDISREPNIRRKKKKKTVMLDSKCLPGRHLGQLKNLGNIELDFFPIKYNTN